MSERLDAYLVSKGLAKSRERAKELIKSGSVMINGKPALKPSLIVNENDKVTAGSDHSYVGRGAFKLIKALDVFKIDVCGRVCADIGASTGGFTQVLLERGADKVYAVDVGHGQLDASLASDERVVNMEGTNVRELTASSFDDEISFICIDVSFISLKSILDSLTSIILPGGEIAALIKPQFEAGKSALNKKGIVKDRKAHIRVINDLIAAFTVSGLNVKGITFSPIAGGSGNIEYLVYLKNETPEIYSGSIEMLVDEAFNGFRE